MAGTTGLGVRLYEAGVRQRTQGGTAVRDLLEALGAEERRGAALWIHRNLCRGGAARAAEWAVPWLAEQRLGWSGAEADELLERLVGTDALVDPGQLLQEFTPLSRLPLAAAEESGGADRWLLRALRRASLSAWGDQADGSENQTARARLDALIGGDRPDGTRLPAELLDDHDAYGPRMRAEHTALLASSGVTAFLGHCAAVRDGTRVTVRWRKEAAALLAGAARGEETVRVLLEGVAEQPEHLLSTATPQGVERRRGITGAGNERLVRGLLWAAAGLTGRWVVPVLGDVALNAGGRTAGSPGRCRSTRIVTTAVAALGECGQEQSEHAVQVLGRLKGAVRSRAVVKAVTGTLEAVAAREGLTAAALRERSVPTVGLDARGIREERLGEYTAVLSVEPAGTASLGFRGPRGRVLKSAPKAARERHGQQLAAVRGALKELRALLPDERARLEQHLMGGTVWPTADWERFYIDHPVTGPLARTLVWEMAVGGPRDAWAAGLPERTAGGWALAAADGTAVPVDAGARIRLWHPVRADPDETASWQDEFGERELRQAVQQVFREVHGLTPAERRGGTRSDRFAGRVLHRPRVAALLAERGWTGGHLGYFDDGFRTEAVRELPHPGQTAAGGGALWRVCLELSVVGLRPEDGTGVAPLCSAGSLRFERRRGPGGGDVVWERAALGDVPRLVLTEAMRDVALLVAVADASERRADGG